MSKQLKNVVDGVNEIYLITCHHVIENMGKISVYVPDLENDNYEIEITNEIASQSLNKRKAMFDKSGDSHYDNISAFIKSMRG